MFPSKLDKHQISYISILGIIIHIIIIMVYITLVNPIDWMSNSPLYWLCLYTIYLICNGLLFLGIISLRKRKKIIREIKNFDLKQIVFEDDAKENDQTKLWVPSNSIKYGIEKLDYISNGSHSLRNF